MVGGGDGWGNELLRLKVWKVKNCIGLGVRILGLRFGFILGKF